MIGDFTALQNMIRQNIGLKTDLPNAGGNLHQKLQTIVDSIGFKLSIPYYSLGITDLIVTANTTMPMGVNVYNDVTINAGKTLSAVEFPGFMLVCDSLTVDGTISASGKGAVSVNSAGATGNAGGYNGGSGGGGGTSGGAGGASYKRAGGATGSPGASGLAGMNVGPLDSLNIWGAYGASGGAASTTLASGAGGGVLVIACNTLIMGASGLITASGLNGTTDTFRGTGGGGGGFITLSAKIQTGYSASKILVTGGTGGISTTPASASGGNGGAGVKIVNIGA